MKSQLEHELNRVEIGLFLTGKKVEDKSITGQHPLYYGTVRLPGHRQYHAYVKAIPGKLIYAEVLSALLGRSLGLPIPLTIPVYARGSTLGITADQVVCVASLDCGATPIGRAVRLDEVNNLLNRWSHAHTAIIFDELIANSDRNLRNVLLGADGKLWLIDHEEALKDPISGAHREIHNHLLKRLIEDVSKFELRRAGQRLNECAAKLSEVNFRDNANLSEPATCQVSDSHVERVVDFLEDRLAHLPCLIEAGLGMRQIHIDLANKRP